MRNFVSAAKNMAGLTRPTIPWIVAGMPKMDRSNLPILQKEKAIAVETRGKKDAKTSRSSKLRWTASRLR